ncbi:MAG: FprA family A-type flavoprotein [Methanomicrobiales archaeon]|nr:FprA family A-type flavoprotein [Methanomicrobiales archaeon]
MVVRNIVDGIYSVGVIDWDRRLFDDLVPLPEGTTYNSYLVRGSTKTALIDTVDPKYEEEFITNLVKLGCDRIDAIIVNHAEQDHSGSIPIILELFPAAKIYCTEKCSDLLFSLLDVPKERIIVVKSGENLDLGGITLEFIETPWVHWPETMVTYCPERKILFPCDLFGSHHATSSLFMDDPCRTEVLAKRYYAEIMMPFRSSIKEYLGIFSKMDIKIIAPSHGPLHNNPSWIIDKYADWTSDKVKNYVLIPYVTMHGSTERMVRILAGLLIERGINVRPFNLTGSDSGLLAYELVDAATVIFATPTVLFGPHPEMVTTAYLANLIKPKTRYATVIGSFGWGGKTIDTIKGLIPHVKAELLTPVYVKGAPGEEAYNELTILADTIAEKHAQDTNIIR